MDEEKICLPCEVVRDLLPSYVESLTSAGTTRAVREHLEGCPECAATCEAIRTPAPPASTSSAAPAQVVNPFKRLRRRIVIAGIAIVAAALLAFAGANLAREHLLGSFGHSIPQYVQVERQANDNPHFVHLTIWVSSGHVSRIRSSQDSDGTLHVEYALAAQLPWTSQVRACDVPVEQPPTRIIVNGLLVWEDGRAVNRLAGLLYMDRNPYVGDAAATIKLASDLDIPALFAPMRHELLTDEEPYGWRIVVDEPLKPASMRAHAAVLLACVGNLGFVEWCYQGEGTARQTLRITAEQACELAGLDVKSAAQSGAGLEELLTAVGLLPAESSDDDLLASSLGPVLEGPGPQVPLSEDGSVR